MGSAGTSRRLRAFAGAGGLAEGGGVAGGSLDSGGVGRLRRRHRLAALGLTMAAVLAHGVLGSTTVPASSVDTAAIRRAVTIAKPSVVFLFVRITGSVLDSRDGRLHGPLLASSKGTGWFVNPNGIIVTATHVVAPSADDVKVALVDRYIVSLTGTQLSTNSAGFGAYMATTRVRDVAFTVRVITQGMSIPPKASDDDLFRLGRPARLLSSSPPTSTDISVLSVGGHDEPSVLLSAAPAPPLGAAVGIIGYPRMAPLFSVAPTYTYGPLISVGHGSASIGLPSDSTAAGIAADATVLGTDAYAEHGDSGGPAVDEQGRVIGLVSFGAITGQPIFLVSAADIDRVLADAHQANALGSADQEWRAGLAADDASAFPAALDDFRTCAASSADNAGCRQWADQLAAQITAAGGTSSILLITGGAAALLLSLGWFVVRRLGRRPRFR